MKNLLIKILVLCGLVTIGNADIVEDEVKSFIDLNKCNKVTEVVYSVCWNNDLRIPESGWTVIKGSKIDSQNIKARPNFYKDNGYNTISPEQIQMPNERGHTFANDSDNDYDIDILKSTYNMINITPMHEAINVGAWRKVENRGKVLARKLEDVISITLVEYFDTPKYNMDTLYPKSYTRIYITEDDDECYRVYNDGKPSLKLENYKIDCKKLLIKNLEK